MPALFASSSGADELLPLAQLGVGPDGSAVLARKGQQLVEVMQLSFGPESPRWSLLEARLRTIGAVDHPGVRGILGIDTAPPTLTIEGDNTPLLAELVEHASVDIVRVMGILGEVARAIATAHHVGIVHGRLDPWAIHVGASDRPRIELTGLATRSDGHPWSRRCRAPEIVDGAEPDAASDVFAIGAMLEIFAITARREVPEGARAVIAEATAADPEERPTATALVRKLVGASTLVTRTTAKDFEVVRPSRPGLGLQLGRFELAKQLGAGAMGEVWEARDTAGGPNVAIKLLKPEIASNEDLLRRFRKEGRVLAKVGSPYIANYVDLNEDKGFHYLVLELVPGGRDRKSVV